jgi:hypothetical protein
MTRKVLPRFTALITCWVLLTGGLLSAEESRFPQELTKFEPYPENPVFTAGEPDEWDARIRERGWILKTDGRWWMWYTGYDGKRNGIMSLGLATSADGVHWKRHPANPLTHDLWVEDMMVVRHDGTFQMFAEGRGDRAHRLTSKDGIHWTPAGQLDVRQVKGQPIEEGPYGTPTAFVEDGTWYLFYERRDLGIWLATSRDLKVWKNVQDDPVMVPGPQLFDRDLIACNQVFKYDGHYYASLHGASKNAEPRFWASGIAVSDDLIHWKKYEGNPLRPIAENKSSGLFIHDGTGYRFYTMHDHVDLHLPPGRLKDFRP